MVPENNYTDLNKIKPRFDVFYATQPVNRMVSFHSSRTPHGARDESVAFENEMVLRFGLVHESSWHIFTLQQTFSMFMYLK